MESATRPPDDVVEQFKRLSTTNVSDALDKLGLRSGVIGIRPMWDCGKTVGRAVTVKLTAFGMTKSTSHLGIDAIVQANPGDVIVIDNGGRTDVSCWGEILSYGARARGVAGVIVDGGHRDLDVIKEIGFPIYARAAVPVTARGRIIQESVNGIIQCGGAQVRPGDIVIADDNGVVVVPREREAEVLEVSLEMFKKECLMIEEIRKGIPIEEVDKKYKYEKMTEHGN